MPRSKSESRRQHWRKAIPALALLGGLGAFLVLAVEVGKFTRAQISEQDRYVADLIAIECAAPPLYTRGEFLAEVQALDDLPSRLHLLDEALPRRLADAFARHPYVQRVERIAVLPSHAVSIQLAYRTPVLEVMLSESKPGQADTRSSRGEPSDDPSWFVDGEATVLPRRKLGEPLPLLLVSLAPSGKPGQPWGAPSVMSAARTAALLMEHQARFNLKVFEMRGDELRLSTPGGTRVLWGHAPGDEPAEEAKAAVKLARLLAYGKAHGGLEPSRRRFEHDVRPLHEPVHRLLDRD
jgi:hypothetical protein